MKKYLITGCAGFIGSNFVYYMLKKYDDILLVNLDKLTYAGNLENLKGVEGDPRHVFVQGDICDKELVASLFEKYDFDYVINFAAESHVDRSIANPEIFVQTNVMGTVNLLQRAKEAWYDAATKTWKEGKKYLQVSTDEVYGALGAEGYVGLDITDKEAVQKVIADIRPDAVIHCAAWTAVDMAEDDDKVEKVRAVNAGGTQNIADACKAIDCKMLYLSTDYVFDGQGMEAWKPDCKDYKPLNVYGQTKLEGELAVANTLEKFFIVRIAWVDCLAVQFAFVRGMITEEQYSYYISELLTLPDKISRTMEDKERIQWFAAKHANAHDVFFIGRGIDYAVGLEGSLKLKEISYVHSEAYAAGELKHGTISLIEDGTLVIGVLTQRELYEKTISNMVECKSRGAYLMGLTTFGKYETEDHVDFTVYVPRVDEHFVGSLAVVPLQLLGYYVSVAKGLDVDKPRNLAKSVTVE